MANGVTANSMRVNVKAPDLGAFPLDHYSECKSQVEAYYRCLKSNEYVTPLCRDQMREYLQCRMDRGLMKPADLDGFGIPKTEFVPTRQHRIDLKQQWLRQKMNQVTVVWEENYRRDDLQVPDGYEREKGGGDGGGGGDPKPVGEKVNT
ncbi:putative CHCH domain containing protein [Trypanosoma cruzi]|nr:putative CHCH domain containing protein [Trypanosoma cruzi]